MKYCLPKLFMLLIAMVVLSCCGTNNETGQLYSEWMTKKIVLPNHYIVLERNNVSMNSKCQASFTIVNYIDSSGCTKCKSRLPMWKNFIDELFYKTDSLSRVLLFIHPKQLDDVRNLVMETHFPYPVCIDLADSLNKLNHFPADERFHCFLLDEDNRVILIGNPVQNPKIKELYIRTICERLGIEPLSVAKDENHIEHNFDKFPYTETKTTEFVLGNTSGRQW